MGAPGRFFSWLLWKVALALLLLLLGLTGVGLAKFLRDPRDLDLVRNERERTLARETVALRAAGTDAENRMAGTRIQVAAQKERATQAERVVRELDGLSSGLNRLLTDSAQLREYDERRDRMRLMAADSRRRIADLEQALIRTQWEKDGLEIALERNRQQLAAAGADRSALLYYFREAWTSSGQLLLAAVALVMVLAMIGPVLWRRRKR